MEWEAAIAIPACRGGRSEKQDAGGVKSLPGRPHAQAWLSPPPGCSQAKPVPAQRREGPLKGVSWGSLASGARWHVQVRFLSLASTVPLPCELREGGLGDAAVISQPQSQTLQATNAYFLVQLPVNLRSARALPAYPHSDPGWGSCYLLKYVNHYGKEESATVSQGGKCLHSEPPGSCAVIASERPVAMPHFKG